MNRRWTYVYCVMPEFDGPLHVGDGGLDGQPVQLLRDSDLTAVVSSFPEERVPTKRAHLSAHERVVEAARSHGTVLPVRFGLLMEGDGAVVENLLRRQRSTLTALLSELSGKSEVRIYAAYLPDVLIREAVRSDPSIVRLRNRLGRSAMPTYYDKIGLGEKVAAAVARVQDRDGTSLVQRLSGAAMSARPLARRNEDLAMSAAFLVRDRDIPRFQRLVDRVALDERSRLWFRAVGPLAPWDFVDIELDDITAGGSRSKGAPV